MTRTQRLTVLGAVLVGGKSVRFGSDKALAVLGGAFLVEHAVRRLAPQVEAVVACGRSIVGLEGLADRPRPGLGPIGGLAAALEAARQRGFDAVLSVPCDVPLLPIDLRTRLERAGRAACLAELPIVGLWPTELGPELDHWQACAPKRSMTAWARHVHAVPVALPKPLANVNTPAVLSALAAELYQQSRMTRS